MPVADYAPSLPQDERRTLPRYVAPLLIVLVAVLLQLLAAGVFEPYLRLSLDAYVQSILMDVGTSVIMAVSLNIVNGYTGQFSIGHAAFYAIGAYTAAAITYYGSLLLFDASFIQSTWGPWSGQVGLFLVALVMGAVAAGLAGWVVGLPSLRLKGDYLAIVTLGFGEIVRILLQQTNHQISTREELKNAPLGKLLPPPLGGSLGFASTPTFTNLFWVSLLVGVTLLVAWRLKKSTFGRSMIAIRENEIAAESMGVNVTRLKVWAFVIAAAFAGVAGALRAHKLGNTIGPNDAGFVESFNIVIMVVLGGLGSISGAALAAVLYVVAQQWLLDPTHVWHVGLIVLTVRLIVWPAGRVRAAIWGAGLIGGVEGLRALADVAGVSLGEYRIVLFALTLILVMILRPGGLFGTHEISDLPRMRRRIGEEVPT